MAGNYFIVFECPMKFDLAKVMKGVDFLNSLSIDYEEYKFTDVWIFDKKTLKLINKVTMST